MVLSSRNWGETSKIVQILTRSHGRYAGLVRGAAAARGQIYAPGNRVNAQWSGRLPEHLGHFVCELVDARSARVLHSRLRLAAVSSVCALVEWLLPEREPEPVIHALTEVLLDQLANAEEWKSDYVRWELNLLRETGAGLDLTRCAVTGMDRNLVYVSPKSGRAVSREGAGSWVPRLLNLPGFLLSGTNTTNSRDLSAGAKIDWLFPSSERIGTRPAGTSRRARASCRSVEYRQPWCLDRDGFRMSEAREVRQLPLADALGDRYVSYALSTIMSRSLPDVRDGLKPVHRRLLFAMRALRLDPSSGFKKCARVVGDVIGKYHPHGDQAVYDAMVRLAQDFAIRYPLVDGQGNFGNVDGDGPAAMRYTEARLTAVADAMLEGLHEDAVDLVDTYDGEHDEPKVLPAAFPNLLANGAQGIAVGMATSIPPHNVDEICQAALHLLRTPGARLSTLLEMLPGPDFPTGGVIVDDEETIPRSVSLRPRQVSVACRLEIGALLERGRTRLVVTEIPWGVPKARIVTQLDELLQARKLPWLAEIRDESADDIRIVLDLRGRIANPAEQIEILCRLTDLETRISLNLNVLDRNSVPRVMGAGSRHSSVDRPSAGRIGATKPPPAVEREPAPPRAGGLPSDIRGSRDGHTNHPGTRRTPVGADDGVRAEQGAGGGSS